VGESSPSRMGSGPSDNRIHSTNQTATEKDRQLEFQAPLQRNDMSEEPGIYKINQPEAAASPAQLMQIAMDVAAACEKVIRKTAIQIKGRQYIQVEGWTSLATVHGYSPSIRLVEKVETGYRAIAELRRISDGTFLAAAEGFVGEDELVWFGGVDAGGKVWPARREYAIRAMAQTRAISRVCRSAFAHVVVLIDAELQTTPAEEMDSFDAPPPKKSLTEDVNRQLQEAAERRRPR
jgi:hypothetical protein